MSRLSSALGGGSKRGQRRAKSPLILTGVEELDAILAAQPSVALANRAARAGLAKACRYLLAEIRAGIPSRYKDAKKAMGHSIKMRKGQTVAKVGAKVGKRKADVSGELPPRGKRPGVGIGIPNVHWFIKGTTRRFHKRTGHPTGRMLKDGQGGPLLEIVSGTYTRNADALRVMLLKDVREALGREYDKLARKAGRR